MYKNSISIHAPARGATTFSEDQTGPIPFQSTLPRGERPDILPMTTERCRFQSTLPRGERRFYKAFGLAAARFQSTLPRGERPGDRIELVTERDFNPRSREGSDERPAGQDY